MGGGGPEIVLAFCPPGAQPGDLIVVTEHAGLTEVEVEVPPGTRTGDEFEGVVRRRFEV